MPHMQLNGRKIDFAPGQTVLAAAHAAGVTIPTLCHHPDLSPVGSCRLCLVEIGGQRLPQAACTFLAAEGLVVATETPSLVDARRATLELLLAEYAAPAGASAAATNEDGEFWHWVRRYAARPPVTPPSPRCNADGDPNPFIRVDLNQCILCTRCVRACEEIQGRFVWGVGYRGAQARIIAGLDTTMLDARCESCGACAAYCPTGALVDRMALASPPPERKVTTTCSFCGVGCQLDLNVTADRVTRVTSNPAAPVNGMALCVKGRYGHDYIHHAERLTRPLVRRYLCIDPEAEAPGSGRGEFVPVSWDQALDLVARRLARVRRHSGPDAVGVLASAKCTNEENYLMQKLARQVLGTHNVDHCARLCHSSTVAGLAMCYGSGAMSNSLDDVAQHAAAFFVIGSNTTEQHPVFGTMLRQAVLRRGAHLVLADPRRIDLAEFSTLHLQHHPGTDAALLNGLMHIIVEHGWHDREFIARRCEGFEVFAESLGIYTPQEVSRLCGVPEPHLHQAAAILAQNKPLAVIWAMGITQHTTGVLNVLALGNLQMLLGNIGIRGGGVNPLRGQNNVQGACDMGALPNVFSGYQPVSDAAARQKFAAAWALAAEDGMGKTQGEPCWSDRPGLTVTEMVEAAGAGRIRALYILGEDPALTEPDVNHVRQCLARSPFIVLQEIFPSATSEFADVLLPGVSFAEKSGSFTNTERRVQPVRQAIAPLGESRADWSIIADLARRTLAALGRQPSGPHAAWNYRSPAEILDEVAALTPSYGGVKHDRLVRGERLQWPVWNEQHPGTPILHVGGFVRGRGKFHVVEHLAPSELPDKHYPLLLTTGRVLYHWHGGELTRRSAGLLEACPDSRLEISPADAARLGINGITSVRVVSRRGEMLAQAEVTERVAEGVVFGNFHFPGVQNVNNLTIGALDPIAKIPEYKVCAVRVEPVRG
jgi:formate dehydrogenase alpha subunit